MTTTIRNLIIAAPLAAAAFTLVPAAAMASEPGPVIVASHHADPQPERVDAGLAAEEQGTGSLDVAWLFAGGLALAGSGASFAVRKRRPGNA